MRAREKWNQHSKYIKLVSAIVCAGLYPRVVKIKKPKTQYQETVAGAVEKKAEAQFHKFFTQDDRVFIHPSSASIRFFKIGCLGTEIAFVV